MLDRSLRRRLSATEKLTSAALKKRKEQNRRSRERVHKVKFMARRVSRDRSGSDRLGWSTKNR